MKQHYHFLGVGGIGMSALARILVDQGQCVTGTDLAEIPTLEKIGVRKLEQLPKQGVVVYSSAIQESHPLLLQAKKEARPLFHRSLLLKELMRPQKALLVTGTHGKTSTSSLLTWVLSYAKKEPSFAVGGILQNFQKNGGWGKGEYFVAEADESDGSFLNYQGEGGIVTNLEKEHLAYWKTEENLCAGFQTFFKRIGNHECFFWCSDDSLLQTLKPPGISYGKRGELKLLTCQQLGDYLTFSALFRGKIYDAIQLPLLGKKLALNGLAVFGLALQLGVDEKDIREAFLAFKGVKRRQEMLGQVNGILIYDDYAHHPTEVKALLEGLRKKNPKGRLIALFEPHRFSRTKEQMEVFGDVFQEADLAVITSIYPAGESPIAGVTGKALANKVGREKVLFIEKEKLMDFFLKMLLPGDLFVTMGAGGITAFGPKLIEALS